MHEKGTAMAVSQESSHIDVFVYVRFRLARDFRMGSLLSLHGGLDLGKQRDNEGFDIFS